MTNRTMQLAAVRRAACAAAVAITALVAVPAAAAHATLLSTRPANDALLAASPKEVVLRSTSRSRAPSGRSASTTRTRPGWTTGRSSGRPPRTVRIGIARELPRGTYTVTWRVISEDSHPISGAFVFHVLEAGANPEGIAGQVLGGGTPRSIDVLFTLVRFFDFALILLVAGRVDRAASRRFGLVPPALRQRLLAVLGVWARSARRRRTRPGSSWRAPTQAASASDRRCAWDSVSSVLDTRFGKVWFAEAVVAAVSSALGFLGVDERLVAAGADPARRRPAAVRPRERRPAGSTLVADIAHVAAAAVWTGGLAMVVIALLVAGAPTAGRSRRGRSRASRTLAVGSVAVLIVAGTVNAYEEVGAWRGLWDTKYGVLLLAKIALVLPLLALGAYNNRFAVPRLRRESPRRSEKRRFLRMAGAELAIVVASSP